MEKQSLKQQRAGEAGFTLLELTIVLLIASIILGTFGAMVLNFLRQTKVGQTQNRLEIVEDALGEYLSVNGKLPCPAPLTAAVDTAGYGREINNGNCSGAGAVAGTFRTAGRGGRQVRIGAIPTRSINLPDQYMTDGWGMRFTYAVTEALATDGTFQQDEGAISIVDSAANTIINPTGTAHFVVISHGEDRTGGYLAAEGSELFTCDTTTVDGENCDDDAIFTKTLLLSGATGASHFDDYMVFRAQTAAAEQIPSGAIMAFNLSTCPTGWAPYASAIGRTIVGIGNYNETYSPGDRPAWSFSQTYGLGDTGGFAQWQMIEDELAVHSHSAPMDTLRVGTGATLIRVFHESATTDIGKQTEVAGSGTSMENRPPFIALLYCQKT